MLPDDSRRLPKHVAANTQNNGMVHISAYFCFLFFFLIFKRNFRTSYEIKYQTLWRSIYIVGWDQLYQRHSIHLSDECLYSTFLRPGRSVLHESKILEFHSICDTTAPSGSQPSSQDASPIILCVLLVSSILAFLVTRPPGQRPPIIFQVFPLVLHNQISI